MGQSLTRGQAKPYASLPRIDWSHPLADGLVSYNYDLGGFVVDLAGGAHGSILTSTTNPIRTSSKFGYGYQYAGTSSAGQVVMPINPRLATLMNSAPFAFATGFQNNGAVQSQNILATTNDSAFTNSGFSIIPSTSAGSSWYLFSGAAHFIGPTGTSAVGNFTSVLLNVPSSTSANFYLNGALGNSFTGLSTTTSTSTTEQALINGNFVGGSGFSTGGLAGFLYYFAAWNRNLSAAEALLLNQDPYCFLIYPEDDATLIGVSSGGNIFNVSATEAGTASDAGSASAVFAAADSETGIAVDTPSASAVFAASDTEAGTATDTSSGLWVTSSTITEAGTAADSESVTASFASSITEANSAADSYVNTAVFVASDTEAGSASDSPSSTAIFAASDTEAASAADSESSTGAVISDGVIEAASAAETETAIVTFAAAASEAGSATDASSNTAVFSAAASEAGNAIDTEDTNGVFVASDTEAATATDLSNGIIPGPPSTDGPHSNPFFATPGPMTTVQ